MAYVIVRKNNIGIYGELDRINRHRYFSENLAWNDVNELQPQYNEKLIVAELI